MNEQKKLAVGFAQMLLRTMAADLAVQKEFVGPDSVLASESSLEAAKLLKAIADGLETASFGFPTDVPPEMAAALGPTIVVTARWS